jgi:hypothetical protein
VGNKHAKSSGIVCRRKRFHTAKARSSRRQSRDERSVQKDPNSPLGHVWTAPAVQGKRI